ncbi:PucR family transcriptional regulator [Marinococcus halophilus]|uniref:PucR family transcriptional regulator n=1 Tax=Marinococcus halophilus TaxID=1371 RepID=UPI0009A74A2E|nr:PucR family transcriptional regulator [Marinococcus halophilus]
MNSITVNEILKNNLFKKAEIVSGKEGLEKRVRWVHIMEVTDFSSLLDGQEMILTTGIGLSNSEVSPQEYLEQLIKKEISCICIELGTYVNEVDAKMIDLSNKYSLPIIIFKEEVKFVEITQSINSLLINRHYNNLKKLDSLSQQFQSFAAVPNGYVKVIKCLHDYIKFPTVYISTNNDILFFPESERKEWETYISKIQELNDHNTKSIDINFRNKRIVLKRIEVLNQLWGTLAIIIPIEEPNELINLMLDRASMTISNQLLYNRFQEEKKLHEEQAWVNEIIHQNITDEATARAQLGTLNIDRNKINYFVFTLEGQVSKKNFDNFSSNNAYYHLALVLRNYFKQKGYYPFINQMKDSQFVAIILNFESSSINKTELLDIESFLEKNTNEFINYEYGISQIYHQLIEASNAYKETTQVIQTERMLQNQEVNLSPFFSDLGAYQMLYNLKDNYDISEFVTEQLGSTFWKELNKNPYLYNTLREYLRCQCVKKDTAKKLYIARQTLYYRLEKIENSLGYKIKDNYQKRLGLELAILFSDMLSTKK